jgi:hypothetical protein
MRRHEPQGEPMAVWIAKFWPDVATHAANVISLGRDRRAVAPRRAA